MKRRGDTRRAAAPIESREGEPRQFERVREVDHILSDCRLLRRARRLGVQESRGSVPAQVDRERPVSGSCERGSHPIVGMRVVWKAVQQDHRKAGGSAALVVADLQDVRANRLWPLA
jgi:hypothetical protein